MKTKMTNEEILSKLEERGWKGSIVSAKHLGELKVEIDELYGKGLLDTQPYDEYFKEFASSPPDDFKNFSSLIVVAMPQPYFEASFNWEGRHITIPIPGNYLFWKENRKLVEDTLTEIMSEAGFHVLRVYMPLKLLAVRSGLAQYGKNNISYVPGMGSFHGLVGFLSDFLPDHDPWQEKMMMEVCKNCSACRLACPTGAITSEHFPIHAGRCIPFHNERSSEVPFPAWFEPCLQDSLVGCLHCQKVCPTNREFLKRKQRGPLFSHEETVELLKGIPLEGLSPFQQEKLKTSGMTDMLDAIPRNLPPFLDVKGRSTRQQDI